MNQVAVKPLIVSKSERLMNVLKCLPSHYTPIGMLASELVRQHIISPVHKPYLGKHPKHGHQEVQKA